MRVQSVPDKGFPPAPLSTFFASRLHKNMQTASARLLLNIDQLSGICEAICLQSIEVDCAAQGPGIPRIRV